MTSLLPLVAVAGTAWLYWRHRPSGAGASAAAQARRLRSPLVRLADLLGIQTARGRQASQWAAGAAGEKATAARLAPLARQGWTVLHDRALLTGKANVDHLVISLSGVVFVIDSKLWSARYRLRVTGGRLLHGSHDVTERLRGIRHESRCVAQALGCPVIPIVSMQGAPVDGGELVVDGIRIIPADRLLPVLRTLGRRKAAVKQHPGEAAARLFIPYRRK
ncbi:nuclease-related domain-containing protein [Streptomyces sp. NPDC127037]|uniref:nuclease-related domain-containing protein n=1 Tax=Streptomyces sp. NPDC127037 TaxID=3347113 RepID=UPI00364D46A7